MSNLSHVVRKFNRFELKYLVPIQAAEKFKEALKANLVPDDHGDSVAAITCPACTTTARISAFTGKRSTASSSAASCASAIMNRPGR